MEILVNGELKGGNVMQQRILRGMSFVAVAVLLGTYLAHGQNQGGVPAEFKPTIEQKVDARSSPSKVTGEEESALTTKGYVKIGTVSAAQPGTKTAAEVTKQMESAILRKASEAGGDVVRFSKEGNIETTDVPTGKTRRIPVCLESGIQVVSTPTTTHSCTTDVHGFTNCSNTTTSSYSTQGTCKKWGPPEQVPVTRKEKSLVSEGNVWRYDPKLVADIARAAEAHGADVARAAAAAQESARKAAAAEAELLLAHGADVNARDKDGETYLHHAAKAGTGKEAELLLAHGADVNAKDSSGRTPLHYAARYGNKQFAELLLAHGADVNAKDMSGSTPLHWAAGAAGEGNRDRAELLLAHGADVNARDNLGETPLHWAAYSGNRDRAELLLAHGADVNAKDSSGRTPLHYPASDGNKQLAELLLAHGADVNAKNGQKQTPMGLAAQNKLKEMVELLRLHGGH